VHPGALYSSSVLDERMGGIVGEFIAEVERAIRATLAREQTPQELTRDVGLAWAKLLVAVAVAIEDSLP
jgi:hypothetical protein